MKLIIAGATGFVGKELIRQSLQMKEITSVVALARRPVPAPQGLDGSKLKSVVVKDFEDYPDEVKKDFAGADACIWTVAITPMKSKQYAWEEVVRVCQTSTMLGLQAIHAAGVNKPFRFLYMSGLTGERDQTKKPWFMSTYTLMRGATETKVLDFAAANDMEACVAKPGLILQPDSLVDAAKGMAIKLLGMAPNISVVDIATAMLNQVVNGFEKEPLMHDDLVRIAKRVNEPAK